METVVIPIPENNTCKSLTVVKRFDWSDFLFSDLGTAWRMIKNRLKQLAVYQNQNGKADNKFKY